MRAVGCLVQCGISQSVGHSLDRWLFGEVKPISPLNILNEDEWGDLEYLYKYIRDGGLFTVTGVNERGENE